MTQTPGHDEILARILVGIESEADFDLESELARHPESADALRRSLSELRAAGMLPAPPDEADFLHDLADLGIDDVVRLRPRTESTSSPSPDELVVPRVIGGRYRLRSVLGRGGMGIVYSADDLELQREVALKLLHFRTVSESEGRRRVVRLLREARITGQLDHPGIVPVYGLGLTSDQRLYYTMKLVRGRSLRELMRAREQSEPGSTDNLGLERPIEIVLRLCDALAFAHEHGVVHRDLSPNNVMVGRFGEVLLMDWGIAKLLDRPDEPLGGDESSSASSAHATTPGAFLGTPNFAAPELARGDLHAIDARTDVFGVGALLHYVLTGQPPYVGTNREEVEELARRGYPNIAGSSNLFRKVPRELRAVCAMALARGSAERYISIDALAADLRAFSNGARGVAWKDGPLQRTSKWVRRHPTGSVAAVATVALVGLALRAILALQEARAVRTSEARRQLEVLLVSQHTSRARLKNREDAIREEPHRAFLRQMRALGVDLSGDGTAALTAVRELGRFQPDRERLLLDGLYQLALEMDEDGVAPAFDMHWTGHLPEPYRRYEGLFRLKLERCPDLCAAWPALQRVLAEAETDPWHRDVWRAWRRWRLDGATAPLAIEWAPNRDLDGQALELLAHIAMRYGGGRLAKPIFMRALDRDPWLLLSRYHLGLIALQEGDVDAAFEHAMAMVSIEPRSTIGWTNLGMAHLAAAQKSVDPIAIAAHRENEARCFAMATKIDPTDSSPWNNWGVLLKKLGDPWGGIDVFQRGLVHNPRSNLLWNAVAHEARRLIPADGDGPWLELALQSAREPIVGGFANAGSWAVLGFLHEVALQEISPARAAYLEAARSSEKLEDWVWHGLGNLAWAEKRWSEAACYFNCETEVAPHSAEAWRWYGKAIENCGSLPQALIALQQARLLAPFDRSIREELAMTLRHLGRDREADELEFVESKAQR